MAIIRLSETEINRIAAGEIIERPASIVKELTENAIDAGSKTITINLEQGGKNLIIITDDGCGMSYEDLDIATERYTTSKLHNGDLLNIHTLGFRGEALSSIANVSKLKITTYDQIVNQAYQLTLIGGQKKKIEKFSASLGTRVEIRDLFFTTPARLKFLKPDRAEFISCLAVVKTLALAYQGITFQVTHNQKQVLSIEGDTGDNAIYHHIQHLLGKEYAENCIPISLTYEDIRISGMVSLPKFNKASGEDQYLFVNGRPVKDKLLHVAVKIAYQDTLPRDRYPIVVIFVDLNCYEVDVNVHPNKNEVRFQRSNLIRRLLINAVSTGLHSYGNYNLESNREIVSNWTPESSTYLPLTTEFGERDQYQYKPLDFLPKSNKIKTEEFKYNNEHYRFPLTSINDDSLESNIRQVNNWLGNPLTVFQRKYLITQTKENLFIIDLEAAYEYLLSKQIIQNVQEQVVDQRQLMFPEIIALDEEQVRSLLSYQYTLQQLGFDFKTYGEDSVILFKIPQLLAESSAEQVIIDLAAHLKQEQAKTEIGDIVKILMPYYLTELDSQLIQNLLNKLMTIEVAELQNYHMQVYSKLYLHDLAKLVQQGVPENLTEL